MNLSSFEARIHEKTFDSGDHDIFIDLDQNASSILFSRIEGGEARVTGVQLRETLYGAEAHAAYLACLKPVTKRSTQYAKRLAQKQFPAFE